VLSPIVLHCARNIDFIKEIKITFIFINWIGIFEAFFVKRRKSVSNALYGCGICSVTLRAECRLRVFENSVLRRLFGPKRDEVRGEWRKLHNKELNDMYPSPNIFRVIKSRRMRWAGHVARMEDRSVAYRFWCGNLRERDNLEYPDVDGRIILRWIFRNGMWGLWTGLIWLRIGTGGGHL
jgi:hypothetical protein